MTLQLAVLSLLVTCICGGFFIWTWGATVLLPIGLTGVLLITLYTSVIVRYPLLCLIASGAGFGLIMIVGSVFAMTGDLVPSALWASLPVFFVINNLLLLNQLPDIAADRQAGRRTLPVVAGLARSAQVYLLFAGLGALSLVAAIGSNALPVSAALALLPLVCAAPVTAGVLQIAGYTEQLLPYLAANVAISLSTPVLLAAGIWLG
jgi:1,4-dihydroxy-2-naphthoate octaprenyltransferase